MPASWTDSSGRCPSRLRHGKRVRRCRRQKDVGRRLLAALRSPRPPRADWLLPWPSTHLRSFLSVRVALSSRRCSFLASLCCASGAPPALSAATQASLPFRIPAVAFHAIALRTRSRDHPNSASGLIFGSASSTHPLYCRDPGERNGGTFALATTSLGESLICKH